MKNRRSKFMSGFISMIAIVGVFVAIPVLAQVDLQAFGDAAGFSTDASIQVIIARLIRSFLGVLGIIAVSLVLYGGFIWMTAGGNAERVTKAKKLLSNAVIGLLIILFSFAIVQFILNRVTEATGGVTSESSGAGGSYPDGKKKSLFYLQSLNTECAEVVQNTQLKFIFSSPVSVLDAKEKINVKVIGGASVEGTFDTKPIGLNSSKVITFDPNKECAAPNEAYKCFDPGIDYQVLVDSGLKSSTKKIKCSIDNPCNFQFKAGNGVDIAGPTIKMIDPDPEVDPNVYIGENRILTSETKDDVGVSAVDFYVVDGSTPLYTSGINFSSEGVLTGDSLANNFSTDILEEWDTQGYITNKTYKIWSAAADCADNKATSTKIDVVLRAANCSNGIKDVEFGEAEVDCGGDKNSEFYCGACNDSPCGDNAECASGQCIEGVCVASTYIKSVSPGDGAKDNLITIFGKGFEENPGTITFLGTEAPGDDVSVSAYECTEGEPVWSTKQVVVQVPDSAVDGPIKITTNEVEPKTDATNDLFGPLISDFDINLVKRPGLCKADPAGQFPGQSSDLLGNGFGATQGSSVVYFNQYEPALYSVWSENKLSVIVPNIDDKTYKTQVFTGDFVCVGSDGAATAQQCFSDDDCDVGSGQYCGSMWCSDTLAYCKSSADCGEAGYCGSIRVGSNEINFNVLGADPATKPTISYVDSSFNVCVGGDDNGNFCSVDTDCLGGTCKVSGPIAQYITIYGNNFGNSEGSVRFYKDDLDFAFGDKDFPIYCDTDFWSNTSIRIKVPATYQNGGGIENIVHALKVQRSGSGALSSDPFDFEVVAGQPGPSICSIEPVSGPAKTTYVTLKGENFGEADGSVTFYDSESSSVLIWENTHLIDSQVPENAETGPVRAISSDGHPSNSISFTVGDCREEPLLCSGDAAQCCPDGTCQASCPAKPEAQFSYLVSTGKIPVAPEVIVSCNENHKSPSPSLIHSVQDDICLNAVISAEFKTPIDPNNLGVLMDLDTFTNQSILVDKCLVEDDGKCTSWGAQPAGVITKGVTMFTLNPVDNFDVNTMYRVTIKGGNSPHAVKSNVGAPMARDFIWEFKTAAVAFYCEVGSVNVTPAVFTAVEETDYPYSTQLIATNDQCLILACASAEKDYNLVWSSSLPDKADIAIVSPPAGICTNNITALKETQAGVPVLIGATVTNAQGNPSDTGKLTIDFSDPKVVKYFPGCNAACINVLPYMVFNTWMDINSFTTQNVVIKKCDDSICHPNELVDIGFDITTTPKILEEINGIDVSKEFKINFNGINKLEANTWYRVILKGNQGSGNLGITSLAGVSLSDDGSNFGTPENQFENNHFSWKFKTKDSDISCEVDRVSMQPELATMQYVGERQEFTATTFGEPDECAVDGQALQASDSTWLPWTATDTPNGVTPEGVPSDQDVAFLLAGGAIELSSNLPAWCSAQCLNVGSYIKANQPVCGSGGIPQYGEECDDGNTVDNDGCSASCLFEGTNTCDNPGDLNCCGNGSVDASEQCDSGANPAAGCSNRCLNKGSDFINSQCGDNIVDFAPAFGGEDCDDGNTTDGDGCSDDCLFEGSSKVEDVYAICGNGVIESGEDCDDGNFANDDGCSSVCLNEGTPFCARECSVSGNVCQTSANCDLGESCDPINTPCCGDSNIGTGEDCDDGNTFKGDGCSAQCLNEGASVYYDIPSWCGGGNIGTGEECEVAPAMSFEIGAYAVGQISQTAVREVNPDTKFATSNIGVFVDGKTDGGVMRLQCSCENDSDCGDPNSLGCGVSGCCYERPEIEGVYPPNMSGIGLAVGERLCRNTAVWVGFDQKMNPATFGALDKDGNGQIEDEELHGNLDLTLMALENDIGQWVGPGEGAYTCPESYNETTPLLIVYSGDNVLVKAWYWVKNKVSEWFGKDANAHYACMTPLQYEIEPKNDGYKIKFVYNQLLEANSIYRINISGDPNPVGPIPLGVLSENNVGLCLGGGWGWWCSDVFAQYFAVGDEVCKLDKIDVIDNGITPRETYEFASSGLFTSFQEQHEFVLTPQTIRDNGSIEELQGVTGIYDWEYVWGSSIADDDAENIVKIKTGEDVTDTQILFEAAGAEGTEKVIATAEIITDTTSIVSTVESEVIGMTEVVALMCENPWPEKDVSGWQPFKETIEHTNFSLYYCRDSGQQGDTSDDLPGLYSPIYAQNSSFVQEVIFHVEDSKDAIGVRVAPNPEYLTAAEWFEDQQFIGNASAAQLDGYDAVRAGSTLYVAAANESAGKIYPNIYVISYNADAGQDAGQIFEKILSNWRFNSNTDDVSDLNLCRVTIPGIGSKLSQDKDDQYINCQWDGQCVERCEQGVCTVSGKACDFENPCELASSNDPSCSDEKSKLQRDLTRIFDTKLMSKMLDYYGAFNGHCSVTKGQSCTDSAQCPVSESCLKGFPTIQTGTFVPAMSNSLWSSWQAELGNKLGAALPLDPINQFWNECKNVDDHDPISCWNASSGIFTCPNRSQVYGYQNFASEEYNLYTQLEYSNAPWNNAVDLDSTDEGSIYLEYQDISISPAGLPTGDDPDTDTPGNQAVVGGGFKSSPSYCDASAWGDSSFCGDGAQGPGEVCEIGDMTYTTGICFGGGGQHGEPCSGGPLSFCSLAFGVCLQVPISCNVCVNKIDTEFDGISCALGGPAGQCGADGECADGVTGYGCKSTGEGKDAVCSWDVVNKAECVPFTCGDGVIGSKSGLNPGDVGYEECDDGALNGTYGHCGNDCTFDTAGGNAFFCGDGYLAGAEQCDCGTEFNRIELLADPASFTSQNYVGNICWVSNGQYRLTGSCSYDCQLSGPQCGDKEINGPEECDGEYVKWGGALCADGTQCVNDADCDSGSCGDGGAACQKEVLTNYDQIRDRSCNGVCNWPAWSACHVDSAYCGNGIMEGDEPCDDGNDSNTDGCRKVDIGGGKFECKKNICGDDDVYIGVESCDFGSANGDLCTSVYGGSCQYCNELCQYKNLSGAFCGDNIINGDEYCDGVNTPPTCIKVTGDDNTELGGSCDTVGSGVGCGSGYTCHTVGVCNGGDRNSEVCTMAGSGSDTVSCGTGYDCVAPLCDDDCKTSCPDGTKTISIQAQNEFGEEAEPRNDISLYSYSNPEGNTPDYGVIHIPACRVAKKVTADISHGGLTWPSVDIVFVTDLSGSMAEIISGTASSKRIDVAADSTAAAVDTLLDTYASIGSDMRIALVSYKGASSYLDVDFTDDKATLLAKTESYKSSTGGSTPTGKALIRAVDKLTDNDLPDNGSETSNAKVKIVVLLSDGDPRSGEILDTKSFNGNLKKFTDNDRYVAHARYVTIQGADAAGIIFYSAALTTHNYLKGWMAHLSSENCEARIDECPNSPSACQALRWRNDCSVEGMASAFAYSGSTANDVEEMYQAIINQILGTNISVSATNSEDELGTQGAFLPQANSVQLPLPSRFECSNEPQALPLKNQYIADGAIAYSNFEFSYCPLE